MKYFASDNYAGVHPEIFAAMQRANTGMAPPYGNDTWCEQACEHLRQHFGGEARAFFVYTGTAANVLALKCLLRSHECVLSAATAHIHTDECGAPEAVTGSKIIPLPSQDGKVRIEDIAKIMYLREETHFTYPRVVSIAQVTESSTLYTVEEIKVLSCWCRENGLYLHMDGARLANACARADLPLAAFTTRAGVDVLSFGGAKNGLLYGEAVIFLNPELGREFPYVQKQLMQLGSKMRFVGAQFCAYLGNGLWLENARHANAMTDLLASEIAGLDHVRFTHRVEGNALFARMPGEMVSRLQKSFYFYVYDPNDAPGFPAGWPLVRFMTSYVTTEEEVREFARAVREGA
jgi:Threonine aldolase